MLKFYKLVTIGLLFLFALSLFVAWLCFTLSQVNHSLLPLSKSVHPWDAKFISDTEAGGDSSVSNFEAGQMIRYQYSLQGAIEYPWVLAIIGFGEAESGGRLLDLSSYSELSFRIRCSKDNVMTFHHHSVDLQATKRDRFFTYRIATKDFFCQQKASLLKIDLNQLVVPIWWLNNNERPVSDTAYSLEKTLAISFDNDDRSPYDTDIFVEISELNLLGRDWRFAWWGAGLMAIVWLVFGIVLFKLYTQVLIASVKERVASNRPLIAYQERKLEPKKGKDKSRLLHLIANEFTNPDLSIDYAAKCLGLTRNKVNGLLREELGLTFTVYLNKLRMAEAAHLLLREEELATTNIALAVGYNNLSGFYRLFRKEYGCTPKKFREVSRASLPGL